MTKTRNRLISVGIALLLLIAAAVFVIPQKTASAATVWDGTSTEAYSGSGSEADPYIISNGAQLAYLAKVLDEGNTSTSGKIFKLTADIDLGGKEWNPIGEDTTKINQRFRGTFDGNGYTISNLKVSQGNNGALFINLSQGTLKNLCLKNVDIALTGDYSRAAAVCTINEGGTIENCSVISGVISANTAGGICAVYHMYSSSNPIEKNCYNNATITGRTTAAGIAAKEDIANSSGTVESCLNTGAVKVTGESGTAYAISDSTVKNSYYDKDVSGYLNGSGTGKTTADLCRLTSTALFGTQAAATV